MTAETLREAAALMRSRAAEASYDDGPWCSAYLESSIRNMQRNCDWDCPDHAPWDGPDRTEDCAQPTRYAGAHIASWHPAVALAVANWLEHAAYNWETATGFGVTIPADDHPATLLARAYLAGGA